MYQTNASEYDYNITIVWFIIDNIVYVTYYTGSCDSTGAYIIYRKRILHHTNIIKHFLKLCCTLWFTILHFCPDCNTYTADSLKTRGKNNSSVPHNNTVYVFVCRVTVTSIRNRSNPSKSIKLYKTWFKAYTYYNK